MGPGGCCLLRSKIPIDLQSDRECLDQGLLTCWQPDLSKVKLAIIPNTLELNHLWATEAVLQQLRNNKEVEIGTSAQPLPWTAQGLVDQVALFPESTQGKRKSN